MDRGALHAARTARRRPQSRQYACILALSVLPSRYVPRAVHRDYFPDRPLARGQEPGREPVPARDLASVPPLESGPDPPAGEDSGDERDLRAAVDVRADRAWLHWCERPPPQRREPGAGPRRLREGPAGRETAERPALLRPGLGGPEGDAERGSRRGRVRGTADAEDGKHDEDGCEEPSHAVSVAPCRRGARYRLAVHAATARRIVLAVAAVLVAAVVLVGASRASTHVYHDDSVWANALSSLGGVGEPYDFAIFLHAGNDVLAGRNPYRF